MQEVSIGSGKDYLCSNAIISNKYNQDLLCPMSSLGNKIT